VFFVEIVLLILWFSLCVVFYDLNEKHNTQRKPKAEQHDPNDKHYTQRKPKVEQHDLNEKHYTQRKPKV
jgi:hypothetical protein